MSDPTVVAVVTVLGSLVVAMFGSSWLNRKNLSRLTKAQAGSTEATTVEITDRLARGWIVDLDAKLVATNLRLDTEVTLRRGAIAYIERLLDWIKDSEVPVDTLPALPESLQQYLSGVPQ